MSYQYPFIEKNCPKLTQKIFQTLLLGVLTQNIPDGTGMFSLLMFYQILNKRSKQHSLLHFLTRKLDQTGFPHSSMAILFIGHVMWERT